MVERTNGEGKNLLPQDSAQWIEWVAKNIFRRGMATGNKNGCHPTQIGGTRFFQ